MKTWISFRFRVSVMLIVLSCSCSGGMSWANDGFDGAIPEPIGVISESVSQIRIRFPDEMTKDSRATPFSVECKPELKGYSSWADNNTIWTYDFKSEQREGEGEGEDESENPGRIVGGGKCEVKQTADLVSVGGKKWTAGTIRYSVTVSGPNVVEVIPARGFRGVLRETDPVVFITFDGSVDRDRFFKDRSAYLSYLSPNAPIEKIALVPLPAEEIDKIFDYFAATTYTDVKRKDRRWVLGTVKQNLIPGAAVRLTVENQASADNPEVKAAGPYTKEFSVRSQFQAEVQCAIAKPGSNLCTPRTPIAVNLNGQVKWTDIKGAYIDYLPYAATDGKIARAFAEIDPERKIGFWDNVLMMLARYFPFLAKYNDTILDSVVFNLNIEPQTQARIVLPAGLKDLDGRLLSGAPTEFMVSIGAIDEVIQVPQNLSFFERRVAQIALPVGLVNQNQKITIRRSGFRAGSGAPHWEPVTDFGAMIRVIRAYAARGGYRATPEYKSPLDDLGIPSTVTEQKLSGTKNRPMVLQFPFASREGGHSSEVPVSGLYPFEISSPAFEAAHSHAEDKAYYNPKYVLAQVTDLTVHMKKGAKKTLLWVTRLSDADPLVGAQVEIFNCLGQKMLSLTSGRGGLVTFDNMKFAETCKAPENTYSPYFNEREFFVAAQAGSDVALVHSSWSSSRGEPMSAPGVEWFDGDIEEGQPFYHAIVGVNLVKPGQQVPVEFVARIPQTRGFRPVPADLLPQTAIISSDRDPEIFYEFPLVWNKGRANLVWAIPNEPSLSLGRYSISLKAKGRSYWLPSADIEVAEFKVPLMSGLISFPAKELVQPETIPVNASIRFANGIGAKNLAVSLSYFFSPTSIESKDLPRFNFGSGPVTIAVEASDDGKTSLPGYARPSTISDLVTGADGSLTKDIALEKAGDGRPIAEVLKTVSRPQRLVVRARYQDQSGEYQSLSQAKIIHNASVYVGTNVVSGELAKAELQAAIIDTNMKNVTAISDLEFKVVRIETKIIGEEIFGGLIKNTLERELRPTSWSETCRMHGSIATCPVGKLKEGSYAFQVSSRSSLQVAHAFFKIDSVGRVYGPNDYFGFGDDEGQHLLPLAVNKKLYGGGERAIVSFAAPFKSCQALVTVERTDVIAAFVDPKACQKGHVEVPIRAEWAPNAFVSVYALTGRARATAPSVGEADFGRPTYRLGFANLKINWGNFKANVKVATDKAVYRPGETVQVAVNVKPEVGRLVGGVVTVIALEEKILELKPNSSYGILEAMMRTRPDLVHTITALERIETVMGSSRELPRSAKRKGGDEGGDGGGGVTDFKRKLFDALVAFKADVPIVNGGANVTFKNNDSLTRFKIFAIVSDSGADSESGADVAAKFGTGETTYLTAQETQSYANIPSVASTGDQYPLRVTIQNNSARDATYTAEIKIVVRDSSGKIIDTKTLRKNARIGASSSAATEVGQLSIDDNAARVEYVINIYDENGVLVDAQEPPAQTVSPAVPLAIRDSLISQTVDGVLTKALVKDSAALPGKGRITVSASKSLVLSAISQIAQRMSYDRFADFFIESRFSKALIRSSEDKPEELKSVLTALLGYTDAVGLIKYHPSALHGSIWLTAFVINSLQDEPWSMKHVPPALLEKLKAAVDAVIKKTISPEYVGKTPMAWMRAQVVMGRAAFAFGDQNLKLAANQVNEKLSAELARDPLAFGQPVEKWSNIDLLERWLLEVYAAPESALTSPLLKQLTSSSRLVYSGNMAQLRGRPFSDWFLYSDETTEGAKLLSGLARLRGDRGLTRNLAVGLVNANVRCWYSLATMLNVAQGLKGFARAYEAEPVAGTTAITIPEIQASTTVNFDQKVAGALTAEWATDRATIQVQHTGAGQPWVSVQGLAAVPLTSPQSQGLAIDKSIRNLMRASGYQAGDVVEVTLVVHSTAAVDHVALFDPIPAGANILSAAYGYFSSGQASYSGYRLYFEYLPAGVSTVKYQYQLNNPGLFHLPPTRAEGLHLTSVFGEAPNPIMTVQ